MPLIKAKPKPAWSFDESSPKGLGMSELRTQRLFNALQSEIDRKRVPGAVVMIGRNGRLLCEVLGQQDPQRGVPMAKDSIFRIYSMTKPIVSVAAMLLVEQGLLLLHEPVGKYLPEFANQQVGVERDGKLELEAPKRAATVQDLLRHTAGLAYEFSGGLVAQQYAALRPPLHKRSNEDFSRAIAALPLMHQPGTVWEYSRATDVLGRLVEVISGQKLGEFLQRHILDPLGMFETAFSVPAEKHGRIAEPFEKDPDGGPPFPLIDPRTPPAFESGGGGLMSTAGDYARFLQFMVNKGELGGTRLLSKHTVAFMTADHLGNIPAPSPLVPAGYGFGLGFAVRKEPGMAHMPGSVGSYYWGGIAGTTFWVDPELNMFAMMLIQAPNQRDYFRPLFRNLVHAAIVD